MGKGWYVDCEYNRDIAVGEYYSKRLNFSRRDLNFLTPSVEDENGSTVFPDVIVHRRGKNGKQGGNLLVIEAKKTSSGDDGEFDRLKKLLRATWISVCSVYLAEMPRSDRVRFGVDLFTT